MNADQEFKRELAALINRYSLEQKSNTPDFVLAEVCFGALQTWNKATDLKSRFFTVDVEAKVERL
jgi:hypothetical protein